MSAPDAMTDAELEAVLEPFHDLMDDMILATIRDDKERGFRVCWNQRENKAEMLEACQGTRCGVEIPQCPGSKVIQPTEDYERYGHLKGFASFHTHPKGGGWAPSPGDITSAWGARDLVECVGVKGVRTSYPKSKTTKKKAIACYKVTQNFDTIEPFLRAQMSGDRWVDVQEEFTKALFTPSEKTIFRRIFTWER